jgi:hypothetical protein
MSKQRTISAAAILFIIIVSLLAVGCGGGNGSEDAGKTSPEGNAPIYELNQPVPFDGATFTFTKAEKMDTIPVAFEDEEISEAENGAYLVVYFDFQGAAANESAGVDTAIFKLTDASGISYSMDTDLANHEASDLAHEKKLSIPSMLMWNSPETKHSLLVFDVDAGAKGFVLDLIQSTSSGVETLASVNLGI